MRERGRKEGRERKKKKGESTTPRCSGAEENFFRGKWGEEGELLSRLDSSLTT